MIEFYIFARVANGYAPGQHVCWARKPGPQPVEHAQKAAAAAGLRRSAAHSASRHFGDHQCVAPAAHACVRCVRTARRILQIFLHACHSRGLQRGQDRPKQQSRAATATAQREEQRTRPSTLTERSNGRLKLSVGGGDDFRGAGRQSSTQQSADRRRRQHRPAKCFRSAIAAAMRKRVPRPAPARTAISLRRAEARTSIRFDRLAHVISSTQPHSREQNQQSPTPKARR